MKKVVISTESYLSISDIDIFIEYCKECGFYFYRKTDDFKYYIKITIEDFREELLYDIVSKIIVVKEDLGDKISVDDYFDKGYYEDRIHCDEIEERECPILIEYVERGLIENAKVVEIPDDVDYYIEDNSDLNGREFIVEKSRRWG